MDEDFILLCIRCRQQQDNHGIRILWLCAIYALIRLSLLFICHVFDIGFLNYDQLYCISWTIINYTGLIRNTICCWYLMMEASVHIISYVLHLDLSSSNKSCSSSVILLLHKHIQRITIAQCHSLVADTTLRWNVHLRIFRSLINHVSRHFEGKAVFRVRYADFVWVAQ